MSVEKIIERIPDPKAVEELIAAARALEAERDRLRELLREAREDVENREAFCLLISNAQGVGEYTREHTARLAERKKALLVRIDAALSSAEKT